MADKVSNRKPLEREYKNTDDNEDVFVDSDNVKQNSVSFEELSPFFVSGKIDAKESGFRKNINPFDNPSFVMNLASRIQTTVSAYVGTSTKEETFILGEGQNKDGFVRYYAVFPYFSLNVDDANTVKDALLSAVNKKIDKNHSISSTFKVSGYDFVRNIEDYNNILIPHQNVNNDELETASFKTFLKNSGGDVRKLFTEGIFSKGVSVIRQKTLVSTDRRFTPEHASRMKSHLDPSGTTDEDISAPKLSLLSSIRTARNTDNMEYINSKYLLNQLLTIINEIGILTADLDKITLIGEAIWGVYEGSLEGLSIWEDLLKANNIKFNNIFPDSDIGTVYRGLNSPNKNYVSLIEFIGKYEEGRDRYERHLDLKLIETLGMVRKFTAYNVATLFHYLYITEHVYDDVTSVWYYYKNGVWVSDSQNIHISNIMNLHFHGIMSDYYQNLKDYSDNNGDDVKDKLKSLAISLDQIRSSGFKISVLDVLKNRMVVKNIGSVFNSRWNTYQVSNGVFVFVEETKDVIFRPVGRQDYMTMKSSVPYIEDYTIDHPDVQFALGYYKQVISDDATRECRLRYIGSTFYRGNTHHKKMSEVYGNCDNSKSVETNVIKEIHGSYGTSTKVHVFTQDAAHSSTADTAIMGLDMAAYTTCDEPERGSVFKNTSLAKKITGGDDVKRRGLYKNEVTGPIPTKIEIVTNFTLDPAPGDTALEGRILYFKYESTWSDNADDTEENRRRNYYKKDPNFRDKLRKYYPAFLWLYIYYAKIWFADNKNLRISPKMKQWEAEIQASNDFYTQYFEIYYSKRPESKIVFNTFIASADSMMMKSKHKHSYSSKVLEKYLGKWLETTDYVTVGEDGVRYIVGIACKLDDE